MKEVLLNNGDESISCEVNDLKLSVRFGDDRYYFQYTLRNADSYDGFKDYIQRVYNSYADKNVAFAHINDLLQSDEIDDYVTDRYIKTDPRTEEEIIAYEREASDKVWLMRSCDISRKEPIDDRARPAVERIFNTYDDIPLDGYDLWECGYWNGIMSALRWVLGEEKDFLDT